MSDTPRDKPNNPNAQADERCDGEVDRVPDDADERIAEAYTAGLESQRPDSDWRAELLADHEHHLVRDTTSKLTETEEIGPGMVAEKEADIPDTFCFTCEEWVGLSGVDLRGRPRSRKEAYYLGGPPREVENARQEVRDGLANLVASIVSTVPHVDDADEALAFIETEREKAEGRLEVVDGAE